MLADLQAYKGAGQEIRDVCSLMLITVLWKQNQAKLNVFFASLLYLSMFCGTIQKSSLKLFFESMLLIMGNIVSRDVTSSGDERTVGISFGFTIRN